MKLLFDAHPLDAAALPLRSSHVPRLENSFAGGAGEYHDHRGGDDVFLDNSPQVEEKYASGIALTRLQVLVRSLKNVVTAKVKIKTHHDYAAIVPVAIPDLNEVRKFAAKLHAKGKAWKGEAFGWQAEYNPQSSAPPLDSKMTFTPADFCIGENGIWFFSLMWEHGSDAAPAEFLDDRGILKKTTRLIGLRFVGASMEAASTSNAGRTYCRNSVMN